MFIRCCFVNTLVKLLGIWYVSQQWFKIPMPRFPPSTPPGLRVRRLLRYYQGTLTPYDSSRRTSFPSIGDTSFVRFAMSEGRTLSDLLWSPGLFRDGTRKPQGLSSSRETSIVRSHSFQRPRSDHSLQTSCGGSGVVPVPMKAETLTFSSFSRLNSEAFGLTVYASP